MSSDNHLSGIRETDLNDLCMDILDYSERITDIFEKIDLEVESITDCYKGQSSEELIKSYKSFQKNYSIAKNNVVSYSDDLIKLSNLMKEGLQDIQLKYEEDTNEARMKAKNIN